MDEIPPGQDFDLVVIGGGSGGYAAARTAHAAGWRVAVVDGAAELGGSCILRGCMPSKTLIQASDVLHQVRRAALWGIQAKDVTFDFGALMQRKRDLVREFALFRQSQLEDGRFTLIRANAEFADPHTLNLSSGGTVSGRRILLSTGSLVAPPPLPALAELDCITSTQALSLEGLPRSLVVLGGGPIALEFAQFFARLDVTVTVIQRSEHVLREFDTDAATEIERVLRGEGLSVFTGTRLLDARRHAAGLREVTFEHQGVVRTAVADEVLLALGRVPNTAELHLDRVGVATRVGRIEVNEWQQTTVSHIYAAGDCTGPYDIVHVAIQQGEVAVKHMLGIAKRPVDYRLLMQVVFVDPQVACVGHTEKSAAAIALPYRVACYPFGDHGKAIIGEHRDGFVKLLASPTDGRILGGACVGPMAGELIHEITIAMAAGMTAQALAATPHYHPTLAEIWTYPAEELAESIPVTVP